MSDGKDSGKFTMDVDADPEVRVVPGNDPKINKILLALMDKIEMMKAKDVNLVLASVYYDPRHSRFVSENTGATVLQMANQAGAREGTEGYLEMVDYNVRQVVEAFRNGS